MRVASSHAMGRLSPTGVSERGKAHPLTFRNTTLGTNGRVDLKGTRLEAGNHLIRRRSSSDKGCEGPKMREWKETEKEEGLRGRR